MERKVAEGGERRFCPVGCTLGVSRSGLPCSRQASDISLLSLCFCSRIGAVAGTFNSRLFRHLSLYVDHGIAAVSAGS